MIDHLTANDIVHLNERTIRSYGGRFTPPEKVSEEALIAIADEAANGVHDKLAETAAFYFHALISRQIFPDGNGKTALLAARTFIFLNEGIFHKKLKVVSHDGKQIPGDAAGNQEILRQLVIQTTAGELTLDNLKEWFRLNVNF